MGVRERKEREREQRRHDILSSARQAFEKHGIQHASMDKIAEEAELSKGTLYLYYKNRDELLMALIAEDLVGLIERLEKVAKGKESPDKKLIKAVTTFHTYSMENAFLYEVMTQMDMRHLLCPQDQGPSEFVAQFTQLNDRMMQIMVALIQEGVDSGLYKLEHPVKYVVLQLLFALKGTMVILRNGMVPPEWAQVDAGKIMHDTVKLFIRGLTCPLTTTK
jgi:AcrR family transcriptional regulator